MSWRRFYLVEADGGFMPLVGSMQPQFIHAVAVVVAGITLQVHGVANGHAL